MKKNGFTLVEIIVCLVLIVLIGTISIVVINKNEKVINTSEIPNIVKDSISVYTDNNKEDLEFKEYCNEGDKFDCSYITYGELVDNGLIKNDDANYNKDDCFRISKSEQGMKIIEKGCKSDTPVIILTKIVENIEMGESRVLKDYIKNINPLDGNVTVKINGETKNLNFDVSSLSGGTYNIVFSIKNSSNETASKTLVLTVEGSTIADVIKQKLPDCVKSGSEYNEDLCAFKGTNPENYLWYSGFTWRVIGINKDGTIKMITQKPVAALDWGEFSKYENSYIRKWLNEINSGSTYDGVFYYALNNPENYIEQKKWNINSTSTNLSSFEDYIGLLSKQEYERASTTPANPKNNNYLNIGTQFFLGTMYSSSYFYAVYETGVVTKHDLNSETSSGVRPIINLKSTLTISEGEGTEDRPYRLEGDLSGSLNTKLNTRHVGEYVSFGGKMWRISDITSEGYTQLTMNSLVKNSSGNIITREFDSRDSGEYSRTKPYLQLGRYQPTIKENIGYYLNNDFYNTLTNNSWIVSTSWDNARLRYYKDKEYRDYEYAITNTASERYCSYYKNCTNFIYTPVTAKVGAPKVGDIFSGRDIDVVSGAGHDQYSYFLLTQQPYFISYPIIAVDNNGTIIANYSPFYDFSMRPSIRLKTSIKIAGGSGTPNDPYTLKS